MSLYYQDNHIKIFNKDCRAMTELLDESIQCVVTSPPYWGLRKYSGEQELIWGGDNHCEHQWATEVGDLHYSQGYGSDFMGNSVRRRTDKIQGTYKRSLCSLCGAWKGAYGLEPTPEMYIEHTIEILREIRRVLRKDGVVFWNIGDSYAANRSYQVTDTKWRDVGNTKGSTVPEGLKPKDLCLIPFRIAIAAQEDGWWVRSVIIWSKPNPMPESVTDRPTESHEYILMLTKNKSYYWDADAVREPYSPTERWGGEMYKGAKIEYPNKEDAGLARERSCYPNTGRNIRTVWEFPTKPGPSGKVRNFAVSPEKLPEICIKATTPEVGCCSRCGAPWERIIDKGDTFDSGRIEQGRNIGQQQRKSLPSALRDDNKAGWASAKVETLGWQPTCKCNADKVPSLVLDPFLGAGTVAWVAKKLNRYAVGYEISQEYCRLSLDRNRQQILL